MKIIISPAKKMNIENDVFTHRGFSNFMKETDVLLKEIKKLSYDELKDLWKCNDKIATLNFERFSNMDIEKANTPAILSYEGLQYQNMAPSIFTYDELDYIEDKLRILSGFYGVLKPFDAVTPYRLEMQGKLVFDKYKDLYDFWDDKLYKEVIQEDNVILNLASKEYSKTIEKFLNPKDRFVTVVFGELIDGKVKQKGTFAKIARGKMVQYMAKNKLENIEDIKKFNELNLKFSDKFSNYDTFVFIVE
ncbi:MAG: peroxide stress protein YaaA [Lachnospirales bacterium]